MTNNQNKTQINNNRLFDKLDKLDDKIDRKFEKTDRRLDGVEKELIVYNEQLKIHVEGVRQLKQENEMLREYIDLETNKLTQKIEPIKEHFETKEKNKQFLIKMFQIFSYIMTAVSMIVGIVYTIGEK